MISQPTVPTTDSLAAAFEQHLASQADAPAWWLEMKRRAFAEYARLPMPTRKNEQWRFSSLSGLQLDGFSFGQTAGRTEAAGSIGGFALEMKHAGRIVFSDGNLVSFDRVDPALEARGVILEPLADALVRHRELLEEYFMAQEPHLGSEKFAALHSAFVSSGCLLYVPPEVELELPVIASHWAVADGSAVLPHTLVIAGDRARVTLIDAFGASRREQRNFVCGFNHLFAGNGARIDYYALQNWGDSTLGFQINSLSAGRDATINSLAVNLGCRHYRSETQSILKGEGANVEMLSLSVTSHDQEMDQRTLQSHLAPNTRSNLLFKNALADESRTIFSGLIRVAEEAQKTDAFQSNRNLLLSPTAEANSLPGLEIQANDVRCTHGATTGQIDESELFYLLARGIDPDSARQLLVFGFFEEVLGRIERPELAESVRELIRAKLGTRERTPA